MFVAKYPRWVAQLIYKHKEHEHKFSFDGVKDLMKFYFNPEKWLSKDSHQLTKENIKKCFSNRLLFTKTHRWK